MSTKLVSIGVVAKMLGVSVNALRGWEDAGVITSYRTPGGHRRYDLEAVRAIIFSTKESNRDHS